ncbi:MAG: hypothetical protein ACP5KC_10325, partial [Infirmifilum sp.]
RPGFTARLRDEVLAVVPGGGNTTVVTIKALRDLPSIAVRVPERLKPFVTVEPAQVTNLKSGETATLTLRVEVPPNDISDAIVLQAVDSVVFLPIKIRVVNKLLIAQGAVPTEVYEGKSITLRYYLFNEKGDAVSGATVRLRVNGQTYSVLEYEKGSYVLNLTGLAAGRYTITAEASKTGYANTSISTVLRVLVIGDVNRDGVVDYKDLAIIVANYGIEVYSPADVNNDNTVNYKDLAIVVGNYGRKT